MSGVLEFFIPNHIADLEDAKKIGSDCYHVEGVCEFDVPERQQLDDLTRLFDALHHEKSPTALFTKQDLFLPLYSYVRAIREKSGQSTVVTRVARHKICHEVGERLKKLLQVAVAFLKKQRPGSAQNGALEVCLRSTLKMYAFLACNVLLSVAPPDDDESPSGLSQQQSHRKRSRRDIDGSFGDDGSGVDMDGRELVLTALVELCSPDVMQLWPECRLEDSTLNLVLKMCLHMVTLKQNVGGDAQSVGGALALLFARASNCILSKKSVANSTELVTPLVELSLKSESASVFLSKLVSDIEQSETSVGFGDELLRAIFETMSRAALYEAANDSAAAKNVACFFGEVAKQSVTVVVKMADLVIPALQSENYDIRKAVVTCIAEMVLQRYTGHARNANDDAVRNSYLKELLFRVMDVNAFVRNHVLHTWERLVESRAVPKRYHLAVMAALVGRLEDRNYLVRDAAMTVISSVLRKNWFGNVLNSALVKSKLEEALRDGIVCFGDTSAMEKEIENTRAQFQPAMEVLGDPLDVNEEEVPRAVEVEGAYISREEDAVMSDKQTVVINRIVFYQNTLCFVELIKQALQYACVLLDSKTERDVIESIKLIVVCSEYRVQGGERAFLKVLVMVFEGEIKIQFAVRDAFAEVVFNAFNRVAASSGTRVAASAQKLISLLRCASEGEVSAVDRIFGLMKANPALARHLSAQFVEAMWSIAEGSIDADATDGDRRIAMRIYSLLSKYVWKDLRARKDSIVEFLCSDSHKDNVLLSYVFAALQSEALDPQFRPIPADEDVRRHPVLRHVVNHLCRRTEGMASWMILAEAGVNVIHTLCEVPVMVYNYILEYYGSCENLETQPNRKAQCLFLLGHTALKQLVAVEAAEKAQLKALEEPTKGVAQVSPKVSDQTDSMHKELGLGSHELRRHEIQELAQKRKQAIISPGSVWSRFADMIVATCRKKFSVYADKPFERVCAVLALCQYMIVNEGFCSEHLSLLFAIVADKRESWVTKVNVVIALGDLVCVHPNLLGPYLSVPTTGFFKLLVDEDVRVRAVTIQVCSHLVLGEMLRIRDHLYTIVKLVADPDETIANNAVTFVQNLAMKEKEKIGNLIPPLATQLSNAMPFDKFQLAMRTLLERVEGDKATDSLIDRLCQRFESFSERSKKKLAVARNIAFCLSELNYTTERTIKRLTSESCYQQYRHWLRCADVYEYFKLIATKAKKQGRGGPERRDRAAVEEWEARMQMDSCAEADGEEKTSVAVAQEAPVE
ncbi:putative condensin subunit 1 [Leishmania infantum JPCM5]|uniref:Condensin_subunit_1_-_putative n=2 Tax=Leishmania infantum TaxID=5671 RepID=A0A6L0WZJ1_LEIIN|nr:putative condensin subunit 1 [Leishmania infantum JPCM5]CAC9473638.1 condensin_subunit_1_-_putative [Leishmania infantum]CAM66876.1 putative condensin subunit 1 [Leishmania infantum JPCM5]SUZ40575.1 condensin_subunit_1_-_putative [Leishmania infantum]|eukprot:XP_001464487.1 putative condensin subunit 1 [Leishmania infantum JPCM5]